MAARGKKHGKSRKRQKSQAEAPARGRGRPPKDPDGPPGKRISAKISLGAFKRLEAFRARRGHNRTDALEIAISLLDTVQL